MDKKALKTLKNLYRGQLPHPGTSDKDIKLTIDFYNNFMDGTKIGRSLEDRIFKLWWEIEEN